MVDAITSKALHTSTSSSVSLLPGSWPTQDAECLSDVSGTPPPLASPRPEALKQECLRGLNWFSGLWLLPGSHLPHLPLLCDLEIHQTVFFLPPGRGPAILPPLSLAIKLSRLPRHTICAPDFQVSSPLFRLSSLHAPPSPRTAALPRAQQAAKLVEPSMRLRPGHSWALYTTLWKCACPKQML